MKTVKSHLTCNLCNPLPWYALPLMFSSAVNTTTNLQCRSQKKGFFPDDFLSHLPCIKSMTNFYGFLLNGSQIHVLLSIPHYLSKPLSSFPCSYCTFLLGGLFLLPNVVRITFENTHNIGPFTSLKTSKSQKKVSLSLLELFEFFNYYLYIFK